MGLNYPYIIGAIIIVAAIIGAAYLVVAQSSPVVKAGDTIQVYYTGKLTNGTVFDSNVGGQPLEFTVGAGQMIKGFDSGVLGMKLNQTRNITVPVNEAYGPVNPALVVKVPRDEFNNTVYVGMRVEGRTNAGQTEEGVITALNTTIATVNLNSPLAGQTLLFQIRVISINSSS